MVLENEDGHPSRWAPVVSMAAKIGCSAQTLNEWLNRRRECPELGRLL
jgi:uncharacterized protein YjiS (DUF1127 family)